MSLSLSTPNQRLPDERCVGCQRTLAEVGGQRIVASDGLISGLSLNIVNEELEVSGLYWPPFARWRARRVVRAGGHPWVCQRCAGKALCRRCGTPYDRAPGAMVITDDGRVCNVALYCGMGMRCQICDRNRRV